MSHVRFPAHNACTAARLLGAEHDPAEKFGHDLAAIIEDAQKRQAVSGREIWRPKPKAPIAKPDLD
jgi:hypothetical protein